ARRPHACISPRSWFSRRQQVACRLSKPPCFRTSRALALLPSRWQTRLATLPALTGSWFPPSWQEQRARRSNAIRAYRDRPHGNSLVGVHFRLFRRCPPPLTSKCLAPPATSTASPVPE